MRQVFTWIVIGSAGEDDQPLIVVRGLGHDLIYHGSQRLPAVFGIVAPELRMFARFERQPFGLANLSAAILASFGPCPDGGKQDKSQDDTLSRNPSTGAPASH